MSIGANDFLLRREWILCEASYLRDKTRFEVGTKVKYALSCVARGKNRNWIEYTKICPHINGKGVTSKTRLQALLRSKIVNCPTRSCETSLWIERQTTVQYEGRRDVALVKASAISPGQKVNETSTAKISIERLVLVAVRNCGSMMDPTDPR